MPYSQITSAKSGADAIRYALGSGNGGHNGNEYRNELVSGLNVIPGISYITQFNSCWKHARRGHDTQVRRIIQSFSKKELNKDSPDDIVTAHKIGRLFAKKYFPNRQVLIFTQTDGISGMVHNHIIVNDCDLTDYRGCNKEQVFYKNIQRWTDKICKEFFKLDYGGNKKVVTKKAVVRHRSLAEYVWLDDLRERVRLAMNDAHSEDDFMEKCRRNGVICQKKNLKTRNEDYLVYTLDDISLAPPQIRKLKGFNEFKKPYGYRKLKARDQTLGDDYGIETLERVLAGNYILPAADESDSPVSEEDRDFEDDIFTYCNEIFEYSIKISDERRHADVGVPADKIYDQLTQKILRNNMQINQILGMVAVMKLLKDEHKHKVYMHMIYDLIDEQRDAFEDLKAHEMESEETGKGGDKGVRTVSHSPKEELSSLTEKILKKVDEMNGTGNDANKANTN